MNRRLRRSLWISLFGIALLLSGCGGGTAPAAQDQGGTPAAEAPSPIRIGVLADQSGPLENYGTQQVRGLKLGLEYATGGTMTVLGRPIELYIEDDASDPNQAVQKVRKLLEQNQVDIVQGTDSSGAALAVIPEIAKAQKIFMVDPAAANEITGTSCSRYVFRTGRNVAQDALTGGKYLVQEGRKNFMNFAPDYAFGHSSAEAWGSVIQAFGGKMVGDIFAPLDTVDFTPYLQRLIQAKPDGVVITWAGAGAITLFQQIADMDLYSKMLVFTGIGDIDSLKATGQSGDGLVGINAYYYQLPKTAVNDWLVQRHQELYGTPPDLFTAGGMAAGIAIVKGLEKAGSTDADALIAALEGMSFEGPKGTYTLRPQDHQALQPMYIVQLKNVSGFDYPVPQLVEELTPEVTAPPITCPGF
ncbi:MAG: substrate-binding domain-containing protein [Bacillota bacterium]|nr:substrate-binding domain-containing protein [Bacillota bacterium]